MEGTVQVADWLGGGGGGGGADAVDYWQCDPVSVHCA